MLYTMQFLQGVHQRFDAQGNLNPHTDTHGIFNPRGKRIGEVQRASAAHQLLRHLNSPASIDYTLHETSKICEILTSSGEVVLSSRRISLNPSEIPCPHATVRIFHALLATPRLKQH